MLDFSRLLLSDFIVLDLNVMSCMIFLLWPGKGEEWTDEELDRTAEAVGYGAVKYVSCHCTSFLLIFEVSSLIRVLNLPY